MTPITQTTQNPALPVLSNIKPDSAQFTLHTDSKGIVTSVTVSLVVQSSIKTGSKHQETALSSKIVIPSAAAASKLLEENELYGGINRFSPTPARVIGWAER